MDRRTSAASSGRRTWLGCSVVSSRWFGLALILLPSEVAAVTSVCPLPWNANSSLPGGLDLNAPCPYGTQIKKFDVTIPNDPTVLDYICVGYGLLPFLVVGFAVVDCLFHAIRVGGIGTREFGFIAFIGFIVCLNEFIFKRIVKQPRPYRSCNYSCGFPSGHSAMSIGFFILMILDASYRICPKVPMTSDTARRWVEKMRGKQRYFGLTLREMLLGDIRVWLTIIPLSACDTLSAFDFCCFAGTWGLALLPVPMSRVALHDHTPAQAIVGSAIGFVSAVIWFSAWRYGVLIRWNHYLGKRLGGIFVHNYPLPRFEVVSRCYCLLARSDDSLDKALLIELSRVHHELSWYLQDLERDLGWFSFIEDKLFREAERQRLCELRDEVKIRLDSFPVSLSDLDSTSSDCSDDV
eukprot:TRINITY_DN48685_c0_g1_i1.p1 TRINITY_DN48685_c0_g1~~TRINITY_DN48685_c0_g1_i1.p1  ORF type:complete len:408 (-),score=29.35 TRINITY_DN48685_c0_g1_i1:142-1365(-)